MPIFEFKMMKLLQLTLVLAIITLAPHQTLSSNNTLPGCKSTCGNLEIPFPFGVGNSSKPGQKQQPCFLERKFKLTCNASTLYYGTLKVSNISFLSHQIDLLASFSSLCHMQNGTRISKSYRVLTGSFSISNRDNKFLTIGSDNLGYMNSYFNGEIYSTGCLTRAYGNTTKIQNGTCSGIGCCQVDIPPGTRNITLFTRIFANSSLDWGNCSYSFVVKNGFYNFSATHLQNFPRKRLPLVLDWTVGNRSCEDSKGRSDYACKDNSYCEEKDTDTGYQCSCKDGYQGNPYIGCTDINECKTNNHTCISEENCYNREGSHRCFCPKGQSGNGTKGVGCQKGDVVTKVVIGVGTTIVVLFVGATLLYLIYQKRKLIKLKERYFHQNGGSILLQQLSTSENSSRITQIFSEEELKKATGNFDESLIIGKGGFGTVFKGNLADNRVVAVKKSKIVDESQKEQFINEVIVVSQINHKNVVKLLGCCLEREVPLLVYEFVNNGTLYDFIHTERKVNNETWKTRLRIAAEAAGALSYLHSEASIQIIHRDVKTANILLDNTHTAKVSDFGASRLVPLDQTEIATMVQGTFGYLDPEYMLTSQLTEKSDVYSFGVMLVELLTGEKPYSFGKPEEKRSLTNYFLSCLKEDRLLDVLQVGIMNEDNKKEIMEVAILAAKCLRLNGEERPSMKEVAMELDGIRLMEKHQRINTDQNLEETQYLLREASSTIYNDLGDSSSHQYGGYDSIRDHVLIALDDGR